MFWDFIVPVFVVLLFCYFLFPKFQYGVDVQINHTKYFLNNIVFSPNTNTTNNRNLIKSKQRTDHCLASRPVKCPIGTYNQCTNNILNHSRCNCKDQRSYEVCAKNESDTVGIDSIFKATSVHTNSNKRKNKNKDATRINLYTVSDSEFNDPGKLHTGRTNPYVANL